MDKLKEPSQFQNSVSSVSSVWSVEPEPYEPAPPSLCIVHRRKNSVWTEVRPTDLHKCLCGQRSGVLRLSNREFASQYFQEIGYLLRSGAFDFKSGVRTIWGVFMELFR